MTPRHGIIRIRRRYEVDDRHGLDRLDRCDWRGQGAVAAPAAACASGHHDGFLQRLLHCLRNMLLWYHVLLLRVL